VRVSPLDKYDKPLATAKESDSEKYKKRVQLLRVHGKNGVEFVFGVFDKKSGEHIGEAGLLLINKQLRWGNIGYPYSESIFWPRVCF